MTSGSRLSSSRSASIAANNSVPSTKQDVRRSGTKGKKGAKRLRNELIGRVRESTWPGRKMTTRALEPLTRDERTCLDVLDLGIVEMESKRADDADKSALAIGARLPGCRPAHARTLWVRREPMKSTDYFATRFAAGIRSRARKLCQRNANGRTVRRSRWTVVVNDQQSRRGILTDKGCVIRRDGVAEAGDDHDARAGVRPVRSMVGEPARAQAPDARGLAAGATSKNGLSIADLLVRGNQWRRLKRCRRDQHHRRTQLERGDPVSAPDGARQRRDERPRVASPARAKSGANGQCDIPHAPAGDHDDHTRARLAEQTEDHALVQSVDRVLRPLKRGMDEQARTRNVDDFFEPPVLRTEDAMAIDRRQKDDRELAPFVRSMSTPGSRESSEYSIPLTVSSRPCSTRPTSCTVPSHGLKISERAGGNGTILGFHARE